MKSYLTIILCTSCKAMHDFEFMGRNLNVELGGKARRADRSERTGKNGPPETVKLHISGIKMGGSADELASLFEPYGKGIVENFPIPVHFPKYILLNGRFAKNIGSK